MKPAQVMRTLSILLLAIPSLYAGLGSAQEPTPEAQAERSSWSIPSTEAIRQLLAERMTHNGVGIVVGIIEPQGRRIVVHGKSGARDHRPLDGDTVFQIGSVTKVFTGLLLADMVQRGEVAIDDPAEKYLPPGVRMPQRGRPITLIDLSKHWSALPTMPTNFSLDATPNPYHAYSPEQLYQFLSSYELPREPGKQEYSNLGVALLGRLLARRTGMEYEPLLKQRILQPLGLNSTSIALAPDQEHRLAPGHDRFLQPVETWEMGTLPASGSLRSTANDLLTFLSFNLGERESPLYPAMLYARTPKRALGWGRSTLGGEDVYGHDGGKEGYRAAVIFNPRRKTGVVVLMNAYTGDRALPLATHLLFAGSPLPPAPEAPDKPKIVAMSAKALNAYAGEYRLESRGLLRIARRQDHLLVNLNGDGVSTLFPSTEREFFAVTNDMRIIFESNARGVPVRLALHEGETVQHASRIADE